MKILLLGGTGRTGRLAAGALRDAGHELRPGWDPALELMRDGVPAPELGDYVTEHPEESKHA